MAETKLLVMISSRSDKLSVLDADGKYVPLATARIQLKREIEAEEYLGRKMVQVWINEGEVRGSQATSWEDCIDQAKRCDIFVSIFDGNAGWHEISNPGIGICHAEFEAAHTEAPQKVAVVELKSAAVLTTEDKAFQAALAKANPFKQFAGTKVNRKAGTTTAAELVDAVKKTVREMILRAAHEGSRQFKQSGPNMGDALDWSRLNYQQRADAIKNVISERLNARKSSVPTSPGSVIEIDSQPTLVIPHGIPGAFGISAAREMVGQPFLRDYEFIEDLPDTLANHAQIAGPIHLIGCSKSVTEAQAISLLGFPDATIVPGSFGIYVADSVQKIQLCLIAGCSNPASTKHGVQRFFDWLARSGEQTLLVKRAQSRRAIVDTIIAHKS